MYDDFRFVTHKNFNKLQRIWQTLEFYINLHILIHVYTLGVFRSLRRCQCSQIKQVGKYIVNYRPTIFLLI